jgi:hypothetical protein
MACRRACGDCETSQTCHSRATLRSWLHPIPGQIPRRRTGPSASSAKPWTARMRSRRAGRITRTAAPSSPARTGRWRTAENSAAKAFSRCLPAGDGSLLCGLGKAGQPPHTGALSAGVQLSSLFRIGKLEKYRGNDEFNCGEHFLEPVRPAIADQRNHPPDTAEEHDARQ